jgi:hypothetical protein
MKLLFLMIKITLTQIAIPKSSCGAAKELLSSKHFAASRRGHPKPEFISQQCDRNRCSTEEVPKCTW